MNTNVRARALRGSTALTRVPRAILRGAIRNEAPNAAEIMQQLKDAVTKLQGDVKTQFGGLEKIVADFRAAHDDQLKGKADVVVNEKVERINAAVDKHSTDLKAATDELAKIGKTVDELATKTASLTVGGAGGARAQDPRMKNPHAAEYCDKFEGYFRHGEGHISERALRDLEVKAAMTTTVDPDGGFTVRPEMETAIDETLKEVSPMRELATVRQISSQTYKKLVNQHGTNSGWVGETQARPQTLGRVQRDGALRHAGGEPGPAR
jgi:HK97 family phage major capsid protein